MEADTLRQVKENLERLLEVKEKAEKVLSRVSAGGKMTPAVMRSIQTCQTLSDLQAVSAPFKPGRATSLAERARQVGLEQSALALLTGSDILHLTSLVKRGETGRETVEEVREGIKHIIADSFLHDEQMTAEINKTTAACRLVLETKRAKEKSSEKKKA